jgi:hypothetical protein
MASKLAGIKNRIHFFTGQVWHTKTGLFKKFLIFLDKLVVAFSTNIIVDGNPQIDVLGTNAYSIDKDNYAVGIRMKQESVESIIKVSAFIHPTIMATTKWFLENPYDVKAERIEDAELWFRTSKRYNFQMLTEPLFFYREFGANYYKKYFKGFFPMLYVLKKHSYNLEILKFAIKYYLSGSIYFIYNIFGKESILVARRNEVPLHPISINNLI